MFEKIQELVAEGLSVDKEKVVPEASFKNDLGADSLDLFEMVMSLEDEFGVSIPSEELEKMDTVQDVITYIEKNAENGCLRTDPVDERLPGLILPSVDLCEYL